MMNWFAIMAFGTSFKDFPFTFLESILLHILNTLRWTWFRFIISVPEMIDFTNGYVFFMKRNGLSLFEKKTNDFRYWKERNNV
jgi:hypothetical protein